MTTERSPHLRFEGLAFLLFLLASLAVYRHAAFADPGTFWHTRCGQLMLERGQIIQVDEFTAPFAGQPWRPQQWLAEIAMAGLDRMGQWDTLLLGFCVLLASLYSWAIARLREAGVPLILAVAFAVCVWFGAFFHAFIRPHMLTIALTAWTLARLIDFDRGRIGLRGLAWLIPVNILWTNLHGGVLGGLMMHALCGAWWLAGVLLGWSSPLKSGRQAIGFIAVSLLAAAAPLVNPYGIGMFEIWAKIVGSSAMKQYVLEHQPLTWRDGAGRWVIAVIAVNMTVMLSTRFRGFRITWLMPFLWFALSFGGIRQGPLAMVTALVAVADLWPTAFGGALMVAQPVASGRRWLILPAIAVAFLACLHAAGIRIPLIGRGWAGHDDSTWPVSILPTLKDAVAKQPPGSAIYNDPGNGGFLIWHTPSLKIFMDDRFELCGEEWLRTYCEAGPEIFDDWDRRYHFRLALVNTTRDERSAMDLYLSGKPGRWREIARHPKAVLFEKIDE